MTSTATGWDNIGGGWKRDGLRLLWASEPHPPPKEPFTLSTEPVRDLVRISMMTDHEGKNRHLRIETGRTDELVVDEEDEPVTEDAKERWQAEDANYALSQGFWADLPDDAITGLAYILVRFLGERAIYDIVERIGNERQAYIEQLTAAVGGNMNATLGEAEDALAAQGS